MSARPARPSRGRRRATALAAAFAVGLALLALFAPGAPPRAGVPDSVQSREAGGRRAAASLLDALGHPTEMWSGAPGSLPTGPGVLWLPGVPRPAGEEGTRPAGELHDPAHYRAHARRGAALVLPAEGAEELLTDELGLGRARGLARATVEPRDVEELALLGGAPLRVALPDVALWDPTRLPTAFEPIVRAPDGSAFAVELAVGKGRVVVLADDRFLDNDAIATADHALLLVRLVEELARGAPVRFDEYALGAWRPTSKTELALGPRMFWLTVNGVLLALLVTWRHAWARSFPRDPEALEVLSPLVRARSGAALLERARRFDVLAERLAAGVLRQAARTVRLPPAPAADGPALLEAVGGALGTPDELAAWRAELFGRDVRRPADLERVARALDAIEERAEAAAARTHAGALG